jgi:hypothetical protein
VSARDQAAALLEQADTQTGDALQSQYAATVALVGIGYALLEVADAIHQQTTIISLHNAEAGTRS